MFECMRSYKLVCVLKRVCVRKGGGSDSASSRACAVTNFADMRLRLLSA